MNTAMPPLETERLRVRPFVEDDLSAVAAILETEGTDATTERYVRHGGLSAEVLAALRQPPLGDRAVVLRATGEVVGLAGLVPAYGPFEQLRPLGKTSVDPPRMAPYRIEIGLFYHVHPAHRGQGFATEAARALAAFAFERLLLGRIVATTAHANAASIAVMRHLGMRLHENASGQPPWFQVAGILDRPR